MQRFILIVVVALFFTACGGGSTSSDKSVETPPIDTPENNENNTTTDTPSTTDTTTVKLSGSIIDGEISGATIFLDLNRNGVLESDEPNATSDENGTYTLVLTATHKSHKNYLNKKAPLIVFGGVDIRTGEAFEDYLTAIIEDENETNVTPLTTLIAESLGEELDNDVNNTISNIESKMNEIKANLSDLFDIKQALLTKNPIELAKEGDVSLIDTSLQLHKVAKQMKKAMKSEVKDLRKSILKSYRAMAKSLKKLKKSAIKSGDTVLVTALDDAFNDNELFDTAFKETIKEEAKQLSRDISDYWKINRVALSDEEVTTALNGIEIIVVDSNSSIVQDREAPKIIRLGSENITITQGERYEDLGATARDNKDGNLTGQIITVNPVDVNVVGVYTITYDVNDTAGNEAVQVHRTVVVIAPPLTPDTTKPVITLLGEATVSLVQGANYSDAGATAFDDRDGNITRDIIVTNPLNTNVIGSYTIRYDVNDTAGNEAVQVHRTVVVIAPPLTPDTTKPVITLLGEATVSLVQGTNYSDVGATAFDDRDGNITRDIIVTNPLNTNVVGSYTIRYDVNDTAGNEAVQVHRTVVVIAPPLTPDTTKPVITLLGEATVSLVQGTNYSDVGATAFDDRDGNITRSIVINNPVDTNTVGIYTVTYNVKDQANNNAEEVTRTVRVEEEVVVVERLTIPATDIALRAIEKEALGYKFYLFTDKAAANDVGLATMAFYGQLKGDDTQVVFNSVDGRYGDGTRFQVIVKDVHETIVGLSAIFTKSGNDPINFGVIEAIEGEFVFYASGEVTQNEVFTQFNVGFGGSSSFPFTSNIEGEKIWVSAKDLIMDNNIENNGYYANIKDFDLLAFSKLQDNLKKSKFMVLWFTEGWQESWYSKSSIQAAMDAGYIPVFNYWYFGDKLISGMPSTQQQAAYANDNVRIANFLNELNGTKMLIMEPEFNKNVILSTDSNQHQFATLIGSAIDTIKSSTKDILFSLAMTDAGNRGVNSTHESCGYANCALGDQYAWGRPEIIYNDLLEKLDFISFQEMVGQFSRDPSNLGDWDNPNPKSYSNEELGIDFLAERISNFSKFLYDKYKKPVFLPYIAITTGTWSDTNNNGTVEESEVDYYGWNDKVNLLYKKLAELKPTLKENGLFGFAAMALFDNPRHDYGGYQYFMNNEYHLGLVGSSAKDEIDIAPYGDLKFKGNVLEYIFNPE